VRTERDAVKMRCDLEGLRRSVTIEETDKTQRGSPTVEIASVVGTPSRERQRQRRRNRALAGATLGRLRKLASVASLLDSLDYAPLRLRTAAPWRYAPASSLFPHWLPNERQQIHLLKSRREAQHSKHAPSQTIRFAIEPAKIALFKAIVESYDNLATLRTDDPKQHHLKLYFSAEMEARFVHCWIRCTNAFRFARFRNSLETRCTSGVAE